jgi:uncharacterized membrane protein YsdA (DUF1294 family)
MPRSALAFLAVLAFGLVNALTVLCYWRDKQRARAGDRRISEADLLTLAVIGGSPGALIACRLFRHKTRKQPFATQLLAIAFVQAGLVVGLLVG